MIAMFVKRLVALVMSCGAGYVWAQMTPQQQANQQALDAWRTQNMQRCGDEHGHGCQQGGARKGPSAAEVRAWHERERKVQAEIAKHKATPYYMAIAYDLISRQSMWGGGYYSEKRAIEEALKQCKSSHCQIVTTFANTCAVVVEPDKMARSLNDIFVGFDNNDKKAASIAMQKCEAVHGNNQCSYWKTKKPFCTGYDYSVYGQK